MGRRLSLRELSRVTTHRKSHPSTCFFNGSEYYIFFSVMYIIAGKREEEGRRRNGQPAAVKSLSHHNVKRVVFDIITAVLCAARIVIFL